MPVRYVKRKKASACCICGLPATIDSPLENAHVIGFRVGVVKFKLTPDYLDRPENIKTAHRGKCNASVELSVTQVAELLPKYDVELKFD